MRLQKILTTLTTLSGMLASDANQHIPLYSLPDDLLLEIWDHLSPYDRLHVPAVSQRFREVAFASRRLWKYINISNRVSTDKLGALLARTGTADLHLYTRDHGKETSKCVSARGIKRDRSFPAQTSIQMVNCALVRCTVLAGTMDSRPCGRSKLATHPPSISLKTLECMAPRLRSLWITDVARTGSSATHQIPFPLFGGHTQLLLHVHFVYFSPRWNDPLYRNLTYLRLEKLLPQPSVSQMLGILKRCPNLEYLLLHSVFYVRSDGEQPLPSVALPFLRHLSIAEESPRNIISLIDQLHTNPCLRFGVSSIAFPALTMRCIREDAPWALISRADELIISGPGFEGSACSVIGKRAGTILAHFCLSFTLDSDHTALLIDSIQHSNLSFHSIKHLRFRGVFYDTEATQILIAMFPCLEVLETVDYALGNIVLPSTDELPLTEVPLLEIVGKELCPNLRVLRITLAEDSEIEGLIQWLGHRNDLGYQPLRDATVYADQPLSLTDRKRMGHLVKNIQWRKRRPLLAFLDEVGSFVARLRRTRDNRNDQDEDPADAESERAMSVPLHGFPYLGEDLPDYFSIPE